MKLRPVLLVILLLSAFYYVTTHVSPATVPLLEEAFSGNYTGVDAVRGPLGAFDLTEAAAAPAFDTEEQQNIAVYKKALPSVVNITSTAVQFDFFYGPVPQQGQGSGFILDKQGLILTNNHVIDNAQRIEVTLSDKHKYKAERIGIDKNHDLALIKINAPNLVPATLSDSGGLIVGQARVCDWESVWFERNDDARDYLVDSIDSRAAEQSDRGRDPDGCGGESGELGRTAAELARRGDRDHNADRVEPERRRGPVGGDWVCDSDQYGEGGA